MGQLFKEEEIKSSNGIFAQNDLNKLTPNKGDSIGFYLYSTDERQGEDGKFAIWNGLKLDLAADSIDSLIESAEPINFIPRLVLEKKLEEGSLTMKGVYRLEKSINRGDEYKGKKVRYYAWNVFAINVDTETIGKLNKKILTLQGKDSPLGKEAPAMPTM